MSNCGSSSRLSRREVRTLAYAPGQHIAHVVFVVRLGGLRLVQPLAWQWVEFGDDGWPRAGNSARDGRLVEERISYPLRGAVGKRTQLLPSACANLENLRS